LGCSAEQREHPYSPGNSLKETSKMLWCFGEAVALEVPARHKYCRFRLLEFVPVLCKLLFKGRPETNKLPEFRVQVCIVCHADPGDALAQDLQLLKDPLKV